MVKTVRIPLLSLLFILCLTNAKLSAQHAAIGANIGMINYIGELAPDFPLSTVLKETRPVVNVFLRLRPTSRWHQRMDVNFATVFADDKNHRNHLSGATMNTFIMDLGWAVEYNFKKYREGRANKYTVPFAFVGANLFYYNPNLNYSPRNDMVIKDKPGISGGINVGLGLKGKMWKKYSYNVVLRHTVTFTDNFEGFRTTTSSSTDFFTYFMAGISRNIFIKKKR